MDHESVKLGLLMETAQSHQKTVEALIEKLKEHTQGLDAVVRDQIRRAVVEELSTVRAETQGAVAALKALKRAAHARMTFWTLGITTIALGGALGRVVGFAEPCRDYRITRRARCARGQHRSP